MIEIKPVSPQDKTVQLLIKQLDQYQSALYPAESNHLDSVEELEKENVCFLGAFEDAQLVGCGAVKIMPEGYGEIKRVYVIPQARGKGISKHIMDALEKLLLEENISLTRLETGIHQKEALGLYERRGYIKTGPFGDYKEDPLSVFMEKRLELPM